MREESISAGEVLSNWGAAHHRAAAISATALTALMVLLGVYAARRGPLPGEDALFDRPLIPPFWNQEAADVSVVLVGLGAPVVALALVVMIGAILLEAGERTGAALVVIASAVAPLTAVIKPLFGEHPLQELAAIAHYPSGHVAFVTAVFGMAALLAVAGGRRVLAACLAIPVLGIGPAVLVGGGHVASDVVGGHLLAAAWVLAVLVGAAHRRTAPAVDPPIG